MAELWALFVVFFKIGLFSFGGGYAILPLIQKEVVESHKWITVTQFTDIVAVSQVTPGPIAINSSTYVGYLVTGCNRSNSSDNGSRITFCYSNDTVQYIFSKVSEQ